MLQQVLASPVKHNYQTISRYQVNPIAPANFFDSQNLPQLPRVVTPATMNDTPTRVQSRAFNISLINLSQDDILDMGSANQDISLGIRHWTTMPIANSAIHPVTGKDMQYMDLMKDATVQPLWKRGFGNELGCFFQGIRDLQGTNTCFFVELKNIPKTSKSHIKKWL
jgi:hypothetical protein